MNKQVSSEGGACLGRNQSPLTGQRKEEELLHSWVHSVPHSLCNAALGPVVAWGTHSGQAAVLWSGNTTGIKHFDHWLAYQCSHSNESTTPNILNRNPQNKLPRDNKPLTVDSPLLTHKVTTHICWHDKLISHTVGPDSTRFSKATIY